MAFECVNCVHAVRVFLCNAVFRSSVPQQRPGRGIAYQLCLFPPLSRPPTVPFSISHACRILSPSPTTHQSFHPCIIFPSLHSSRPPVPPPAPLIMPSIHPSLSPARSLLPSLLPTLPRPRTHPRPRPLVHVRSHTTLVPYCSCTSPSSRRESSIR